MLQGLRPDVIMEVCNRALAFWIYQVSQERHYQDHCLKQLKDKCLHLERQLDLNAGNVRNQALVLNDKILGSLISSAPLR